MQGSPRVLVINTSFRTFINKSLQRKPISKFPKLAVDPSLNRKSGLAKNRRSSFTTGSLKPNVMSELRREPGSAMYMLNSPIHSPEIEQPSRSINRPYPQRHNLTKKQINTFAAHTKYDNMVSATKMRERTSESPITTNNNDLRALLPDKRYFNKELHLSSEKHMWISDWVASTSAALRLDSWTNNVRTNKVISLIQKR